MAGYIGSKAVALSTTAANVAGNITVSGNVDGRDVSVDGTKLDTIPVISTSSTASFIAISDGTTDGYIQLNCSANSHGIKLKSPPHSAGASYTLVFPVNDGNANQVLTTNGSGVLSWSTTSTTDNTKLPLAGGALTGAVTTSSTLTMDVAASPVFDLIGGDGNSKNIIFKKQTGETEEAKIKVLSNNMTLSSAGALTLDAVGNVFLDSADGGGITLKNAGTAYGLAFSSSNSLTLKSTISNGQMIFQGNDGGNAVAALTLDMADEGAAIFNSTIKLGTNRGIYIGGTGAANYLSDYEEGYYTPTVTSNGGSITLNTSYNTGAYTKVGRSVTVTGLLVTSAISSPSGYLEISLPFASANLVEGSERSTNVVTFWCNGTGVPNGSVWYNAMLILNLGGVSYLRVYMQGYNGTYQTSPANWIGAGSDMHINFNYFTA